MFVIVHPPGDTNPAEHVPDDEYPAGTDDSVAVQLGVPENPLTVKTAGDPVAANADAGLTVPLPHTTDTDTAPPSVPT